MKRSKYFILLSFVFFFSKSFSQDFAVIYGTVSDSSGYSVGFANIAIQGTKYGTTADRFGEYELKVPFGTNKLVITCVGYRTKQFEINTQKDKRVRYDFTIPLAYESLEEIKVISRSELSGTLQRIDPKTLSALPNSSGNIENLVKQFAGVSSNNELSSQYSVRGGSFDENMVYVNDVQIYRPILIRSGQQEGLSFVNPDLVGSLKFSAGGFDATYGDKMSSVLDITYKKPTTNIGSFTASFLGATAHHEGISKNRKFRHLIGIRYKTSQYLLSSLDTKGEYKPVYADIQTNLMYDLLPKLEISFLGNFSQNKYEFIPTNRTVEFGTYQLPLKAQIYYEGQENDSYKNYMGSVALNYHSGDNFSLKLIASDYVTQEDETFDLLGEYNISEVDKTNNSRNDSSLLIGVGGFLNHARNFLDVNVANISHVGFYNMQLNKLKWGISFQKEIIDGLMNEWELMDSAGYIFPYSPDSITLSNYVHSVNNLNSNRLVAYIQNTFELPVSFGTFYLNTGFRAHYWSLNKETIYNPRASLSFQPENNKRLLFYCASGYYNQPAFYKEMIDPKGYLNRKIKAQKSIHYVLGSDYMFYALFRPFKLTSEIYYKSFDDLIPYRVDNVRSVYAGNNLAKGYAKGIDLKLNGEFVKGTESWLSLSLLETKENIYSDSYKNTDTTVVYPGYYSRPTDQLVNVNLYLQDYLPRYPSYKFHLSIHYGSRLPVTFPLTNRWDDVHKLLPSYKRVDLGISKMIKGEETTSKYAFFNYFKEFWISAEIFNLIDINNTASYLWVKSVSNQDGLPGYFAVPNYLTSRRLNLKISATF